ncbi:MAG: hypothetical protein WC655_08420, partial [Candidatus Hydrogenedentales bacterium]
LLMVGTDGQADDCWFARPMDVAKTPSKKEEAPNLKMQKFRAHPVQDDTREIWAVREESPDKLSRWNGEGWDDIALSGSVSGVEFLRLNVDSRGCVWVICPGNDSRNKDVYSYGQTALYDPASKEWSEFPTYIDAVVEQRSQADELRFTTCIRDTLVFGPPGQVALQMQWRDDFWFYTGHVWQLI